MRSFNLRSTTVPLGVVVQTHWLNLANISWIILSIPYHLPTELPFSQRYSRFRIGRRVAVAVVWSCSLVYRWVEMACPVIEKISSPRHLLHGWCLCHRLSYFRSDLCCGLRVMMLMFCLSCCSLSWMLIERSELDLRIHLAVCRKR